MLRSPRARTAAPAAWPGRCAGPGRRGAGRGRVAGHRRRAQVRGWPTRRVSRARQGCGGRGGRVLPALPEGDRQVTHGQAADLQLRVVPGRVGAVALVHRHRLGIAQVALVVAAPVAQVDAAHEGDVVVLPVGVADQDQLLVLAAAPDPLVEQDLAAGLVDDLAQVQVLLLLEVGPRVGAPQAADLHAPAGQLGQDLPQLGALAVEQLVGVAAPVGDADHVACAAPAARPAAAGSSGPVDQRLDQVPLGPAPPSPDDGRCRWPGFPLGQGQEPALNLDIWPPRPAPGRS